MKKYLGIKIVEAEPEVKKTSQGLPNMDLEFSDGYKTLRGDGTYGWIPKSIFEQDYKELPEDKRVVSTTIETSKGYWEYLQEPIFSRSHLVQFGKYLLSNERLGLLDSKSDPQEVYHADIENYIESLNKVVMVG
jgi:hypothetical protein